MSGGSYDYLCFKDINNIDTDMLTSMINDLQTNGYYSIANDLSTFYTALLDSRRQLSEQWDRFQDITMAWEWFISGDTCEEDFKKLAEKYTEGK